MSEVGNAGAGGTPSTSGSSTQSAPSSAVPSKSAPAANGSPSNGSATNGDAAAKLASATPANGTPATPAEKRLRVKIGGQFVEKTRREYADYLANEAPEDDVVSTYRQTAHAQERMKQAAEKEKKAEAILGSLKTPEQMMQSLLNLYENDTSKIDRAVEAYYRERVKLSEMSPAERELMETKRERDDLKKRETERSEAENEAKRSRVRDQYRQRFETQFSEAVTAAKLPNTKATMQRMIAHGLAALDSDTEIDAGEIAESVRRELREEWEELHGSSDDEALAELFGEDRMKRLRQRDVERLKAAQSGAKPTQNTPPRAANGKFTKTEEQRPMSTREWFQRRRG